MTDPFAFLAYEPKGPGLMCAVMILIDEENVYGWYTGPANGKFPAAFFLLERYYSTHETAFYHSVQDDMYDGWVMAYPPVDIDVGNRLQVPEAMYHALEQYQDTFVAEWLFYRDDPDAAAETAWYRAQDLPLAHAGIRHTMLNKLDRDDLIWTYHTPGLDLNIVEFLRRRWPLDYALAP
ncbi:hypothetical protein [Ralstonia sp. UBA689]|uniref:hypothetical protein n=1 Tax=Ralstonia sp. UBA689 TaxID=1947373 RepID=UPI0025FBA059|nr:hypothetical protein [Ralstonia sp. UBA689]